MTSSQQQARILGKSWLGVWEESANTYAPNNMVPKHKKQEGQNQNSIMIRIPRQKISKNMKLGEIINQPDLTDIQSTLPTTEHTLSKCTWSVPLSGSHGLCQSRRVRSHKLCSSAIIELN